MLHYFIRGKEVESESFDVACGRFPQHSEPHWTASCGKNSRGCSIHTHPFQEIRCENCVADTSNGLIRSRRNGFPQTLLLWLDWKSCSLPGETTDGVRKDFDGGRAREGALV